MSIELDRKSLPIDLADNIFARVRGKAKMGLYDDEFYFCSMKKGVNAGEVGFAYSMVDEIIDDDGEPQRKFGFVKPDGLWGEVTIFNETGRSRLELVAGGLTTFLDLDNGGFVQIGGAVTMPGGLYGRRSLGLMLDRGGDGLYTASQECDDGRWIPFREGEVRLVGRNLVFALAVEYDGRFQRENLVRFDQFTALHADKLAKMCQVGAFRRMTNNTIEAWAVRHGVKLSLTAATTVDWDWKKVLDAVSISQYSDHLAQTVERVVGEGCNYKIERPIVLPRNKKK